MPANAGIQVKRHSQAGMDPGMRRDDGDSWLILLAPYMNIGAVIMQFMYAGFSTIIIDIQQVENAIQPVD